MARGERVVAEEPSRRATGFGIGIGIGIGRERVRLVALAFPADHGFIVMILPQAVDQGRRVSLVRYADRCVVVR